MPSGWFSLRLRTMVTDVPVQNPSFPTFLPEEAAGNLSCPWQ